MLEKELKSTKSSTTNSEIAFLVQFEPMANFETPINLRKMF